MSLLGFDAIGRFAIGQISQSYAVASANLTTAAGTGVAHSLIENINYQLSIAAGTGTANILAQDAVINTLPQATGAGTAGAFTPSPSNNITIAVGTGTVGTLMPMGQATPLQAYGVGFAGSVMGQSTAPNLTQAVGTGVAGQIGISGSQLPAICTGIAGVITAVLSGGGGSKYKPGYGLEPLKPRPKPPSPLKPKVVLPPPLGIVAPPIAPRETSPIDHIKYELHDLRALEARIIEAKRATDRQRQDEADIADVIAFLQQID
jgi:hypothetical protein